MTPMKKETVGLIGAGHMGTAIVEALVACHISRPGDLWIYDKMTDKSRAFARRMRAHAAGSLEELARQSHTILLAVKPQDLFEAGAVLQPHLQSGQVVISILAGTPLVKLKRALGSKPHMVRAMPNLGAKAGESMTALAGNSKPALKRAETIFNSCGKTTVLAEKHFDLVTALSGSGPAYFFWLMEMMAEFGEKNGLSKEAARLLAVQTALGAGKLAAGSDIEPAEWRRRVTSKRGTTEAALKVLSKRRAAAFFQQAFRAALLRGRALAK